MLIEEKWLKIWPSMTDLTQITKILVSTLIRNRSDTFVSDRCLIKVDPRVFAIWEFVQASGNVADWSDEMGCGPTTNTPSEHWSLWHPCPRLSTPTLLPRHLVRWSKYKQDKEECDQRRNNQILKVEAGKFQSPSLHVAHWGRQSLPACVALGTMGYVQHEFWAWPGPLRDFTSWSLIAHYPCSWSIITRGTFSLCVLAECSLIVEW